MTEVLAHDHADRWYDIATGRVSDFNTVRLALALRTVCPHAIACTLLPNVFPIIDIILRQVFQGYKSAVDNPTSGFYQEIMAQYPKAKVRVDMEP